MRITLVSSQKLPAPLRLALAPADSLQCRVLPDLIGFPQDITLAADVLLLSGYPADGRLVATVEACRAAAPDCRVVPVLAAPPAAEVVRLMQAGAADVVDSITPADLDALLGRLRSQPAPLTAPPGGVRSIGVVSAKGGDGATCIAANLAAALARCPGMRVLALDLALPFGDLEIHLTPEPPQNDLADVLAQIDRLDATLLDTLAHPLGGQLRLIVSPTGAERFIEVTPALVARLLTLAAHSYHFVVADLGGGTDPVSLSVLGQFDQILLVATPDIASLRHASRVLRLWRGMGRDTARIGLVMNRTDEHPEVPVPRFATTLELPVLREIAGEHEGVSQSLLEGAPVLVTAPNSAFSRAIRRWAAELAGVNPVEESLWTSFKQLWRAA
ncbi:MAG: hypothetical protein FGM40_06670 [Rhodocyclaceae bacterium]|nr:hypothetical protein [Rhodocyclaceae bacterium]